MHPAHSETRVPGCGGRVRWSPNRQMWDYLCQAGYGQRGEKLGKTITPEWVPKEPKHVPEGGTGLGVPGQRGLDGQDLVGGGQVKPTGFVSQEH